MEENKNIDDLFRSALEPSAVPPPEKTWSKLEARLNEAQAQKKKGNNNRYLLLLLLLLLSFGAYMYFMPGKKSDVALNNVSTKQGRENVNGSNSTQAPASGIVSESQPTINNNVASTIPSSQQASDENKSTSTENVSATSQGQQPVASNNTSGKATLAEQKSTVEQGIEKVKNTDIPSGLNHAEGKHHSPQVFAGNVNKTESSTGEPLAAITPSKSSENPDASAAQPKNEPSKSAEDGVKNENQNPAAEEAKSPVENKSDHQTASKTNDGIKTAVENKAVAQSNSSRAQEPASPSESKQSGSSAATTTPPATKQEETKKDNSVTANVPPANAQPKSSNAAPTEVMSPKSSVPRMNNFFRKSAVSGFYSPESNYLYWTKSAAGGTTTTETKLDPSFNTGINLHHDITEGHWSMALGCTYSKLVEVTTVSTSYILPSDTGSNHNGNHPPPPPKGGNNQPGGPHHGSDSSFHQCFADSNYFDHYFTPDQTGDHYIFKSPCGSVHLQNPPVFPVSTGNSKPGDTVKFETKTEQVLEYINVPLTLSYRISMGRFSLYATGGLSASFLLNKKATVSIADTYSESTRDIDGLRSVNYGYQCGLGARYQFYKGLSVFLEPTLRGPFTSVTQNISAVIYPYSAGVHAGLYLHF